MNSSSAESFFNADFLDARPGDAALRNRAAMFAATDVGFLEAVGPDARSFLQNLGTNDLRPLTPGDGCETFFTTHKARVVAHAVVHCVRDDAFLLSVESQRAESLFKHLDHYLISERVELTPRNDCSLIRVLGPESERWAADAAQQSLAGLKPWQGKLIDAATGSFARRQAALHLSGFEWIGPTHEIANRWNAWREGGLVAVSAEAIDVIRIESGWPRWGHEMDENRFVVELGRIAPAISYAKGCYLGQEPIVMARDRGQVNRQLMGFRMPGDKPPAPGARIMLGEVEQFKVTSSAFSPAWNAAVGLAYVYRGHQKPGETLTIPDGAAGAVAILSSLPMVPG